jgi:hypothetical protein
MKFFRERINGRLYWRGADLTGKGQKANPLSGLKPFKRGDARTCPVQTMFGGFFPLTIAIGTQFISGWFRHCDFRSAL